MKKYEAHAKKVSHKEYIKDPFIPATTERHITKDIVFRPRKSWHSATAAGEKITGWTDIEDRSGCARPIKECGGLLMCMVPYSVTHRLYWNKKRPDEKISAFLSYPDAMGGCDTYFWEALFDDDTHRFDTEEDMEKAILKALK